MELITVVVQRRDGQRAIYAALKAGAPGVTTFYGRGTGVRQKLKIFGLFIGGGKTDYAYRDPERRCGPHT